MDPTYIVNFNATDVDERLESREDADRFALKVYAEAAEFGRAMDPPVHPEDVGGVLIYRGDELVGRVSPDGSRVV